MRLRDLAVALEVSLARNFRAIELAVALAVSLARKFRAIELAVALAVRCGSFAGAKVQRDEAPLVRELGAACLEE